MATIRSHRKVIKFEKARKKIYAALQEEMERRFEKVAMDASSLVVETEYEGGTRERLARDFVGHIRGIGSCSGKFEIIRVTRLGPSIADVLKTAKSLGLKIGEDDAEQIADWILDEEMRRWIWWKLKPVEPEQKPGLDDADVWGDDDEAYIVRFIPE